MFPKLSAPLVKDIRTGEGIFEWLLAAIIFVSGMTSGLSFAHTATYLTIIGVVKAARRTLLKIVAVQGKVGIGAPETPSFLEQATADIENEASLLVEIQKPLSAAEAVLPHVLAPTDLGFFFGASVAAPSTATQGMPSQVQP